MYQTKTYLGFILFQLSSDYYQPSLEQNIVIIYMPFDKTLSLLARYRHYFPLKPHTVTVNFSLEIGHTKKSDRIN